MDRPSISVRHNVWGNYLCFVGTKRVAMYGDKFDATYWLIEQMLNGSYKLSVSSCVSQHDIDSTAAKIGMQRK